MIVMKFGGTSVANAERIRDVAEIVRDRLDRRPVVVVSALGGVTDLLDTAVDVARGADRDALEPLLADLERRHRWALAGTVEHAGLRHKLSLDLDRTFEDLRQRLRSIRILGEVTPRARDAVLSSGELLSSRLVCAGFEDRGIPTCGLDARELLITDDRFGNAEASLERSRPAVRAKVVPVVESGVVPVIGGFVGATPEGDVTTLGRGGSDTSAAVLALLLEAQEIQIWTDVDGLMSADPRRVPGARVLTRVSFAEAEELARHGARVLHPPAIAPALAREIPVRVLNSRRPGGAGTLVVADGGSDVTGPRVAVASRTGFSFVRVRAPHCRPDPALLTDVVAACREHGLTPELLLASGLAVGVVLASGPELAEVVRALDSRASVERSDGRALICIVGAGLADSALLRGRVLAELAGFDPEIIAVGTSGTSVAAILDEVRLEPALLRLHRRFFEESATG